MVHRLHHRSLALLALALVACDSDGPTSRATGFLDGTEQDPQVGVVVSGRSKALTLFQLGDPKTQQQVGLGASDAITVTGAAVRDRRVAVPLGNAASVAIVDLQGARVERSFTFPAGNATGVAWIDDNTIVAANLIDDYVGVARLSQSGTAFADTVHVRPAPTAVVAVDGVAYVVSGNLDESYDPLGDGYVTRVDPRTRQATGEVQVGPNPQDAAVGPDGRLYVVNTGDYATVPGSLSIVNLQTLTVEATVPGFGLGPGSIAIGPDGLAYVSSFFYGTVVWDTRTRTFVRGPDNPLCAPQATGGCRGAADADVAADGSVYQAYYGTRTAPSKVFVYRPSAGTLALTDSLTAGDGPLWISIQSFR